jgi:predicted DNA-binding WGR domain protein
MIVYSILLNAECPALNIKRSYFIQAGQDLFGNWVVEINYGRIGRKGRIKVLLKNTEQEAQAEIKRRLKKRESAIKRIGVPYIVKLNYGEQWLQQSLSD